MTDQASYQTDPAWAAKLRKEKLLDLAAKVEAGPPSLDLEHEIRDSFGFHGHLTRSVDDAMTMIPPGLYWFTGKGKVTQEEPMFAAILCEPESTDVEIGKAENDHNPASCLAAACLRAMAARMP